MTAQHKKTRLPLNNFSRALSAHAVELPVDTYWRYSNGIVPKIVHFLFERPELLKALLEDANARQKGGVTTSNSCDLVTNPILAHAIAQDSDEKRKEEKQTVQ